ncbi:MAG TPA: gluconokinase [Pseudonocardiaceae bacterium]
MSGPVIVVMGVSGSGKTTIGALLAGHLGWAYAEADDFHPRSNVDRMAAGLPLDDADRWPWLEAIRDWIARQGRDGVVSCSALRKAYRDVLRDGNPGVRFAYLHGTRELIERRLVARHGHFMKADMLASQFAALEPPDPDTEPDVVTVSIDATGAEIVDAIVRELDLPQAEGSAPASPPAR